MKINEVKIVSSLYKIYDSDPMPEKKLSAFSMLADEKKCFQIVIDCDGGEAELKLETELRNVRLYSVENIRSDYPMNKENADDYYKYSESGFYPDLLLPVENMTVNLSAGINVFWAEILGEENKAGEYTVKAVVGDKSDSISVEIIGAKLDFSDFSYTSWLHTDCLMSHYNFEVFSDEYWRVTENFLRTAAQYGMNCVLTPIFTPPLDTEKGKERPTVQLVDIKVNNGKYSFGFDKLTKWIDMSHRCGVEYFELSHFYTQWGARNAPKIMAEVDGEYKRIFGWETKANSKEYKAFLKVFSTELKAYFEQRGLKDKVYIHVSDEPNFWVIYNYSRASRYIHKLFKGYKVIDALSDYWYYRLKIVTTPIPANNHIDKFIGNVDGLWAYYCSGQNNRYVSNRFFCCTGLRTRVLGYQLYKFDIRGFLQWGYNFYYTQLSKGLVNPFEVSDAGGKFPSGDSYVVYPADDGTAYTSVRLMQFYDGLQDMAALRTLEALTDRKTCLGVIEQKGKYNLTFSEYPHDEEWLSDTREAVNMLIKNKISE